MSTSPFVHFRLLDLILEIPRTHSTMYSATDTLVVFDVDNSLVDGETSVVVGRRLYPEVVAPLNQRWLRGELDSAEVMDLFHSRLAVDRPLVSPDQIREAAASMPLHPRMAEAVRLASAGGAHIHIISDSAVFYIESILRLYELDGCVDCVTANPTNFDEGGRRLRVLPYHDVHLAPHGCPHCRRNLCKGDNRPTKPLDLELTVSAMIAAGAVLDAVRERLGPATRVLYVGDGVGDFCPATHLTECVLQSITLLQRLIMC